MRHRQRFTDLAMVWWKMFVVNILSSAQESNLETVTAYVTGTLSDELNKPLYYIQASNSTSFCKLELEIGHCFVMTSLLSAVCFSFSHKVALRLQFVFQNKERKRRRELHTYYTYYYILIRYYFVTIKPAMKIIICAWYN